jgi:coenzyme Q-binding protein COQ10
MISVIDKSSGTLPFSREQAFDLAADIERYPEFLSEWISARVVRREPDICYVNQVVGLGLFRLQFTSRAVLRRPERIEVTSTQAPFRLFSLCWVIAAVPPAGCRVSVAARVEMKSRIMQRVVNEVLPPAVDDLLAAFEARAHRIYAGASPQS